MYICGFNCNVPDGKLWLATLIIIFLERGSVLGATSIFDVFGWAKSKKGGGTVDRQAEIDFFLCHEISI